MKTRAIVFDIDGTLSDPTHRLHHILGEKKDWKSFFAEAKDDPPILPMCYLAGVLIHNFQKVIFLTGRSEIIKEDTFYWLEEHLRAKGSLVPSDLVMRADGDRREDDIVKKELFLKYIEPRYDVEIVVEDRARCVKMWRELGLVCLQCAEGNF